ncbi:aminoglycoside phosphotransferase family protein [Loktanella sp. R86503]|uniref:aminoglycoside phosphotransferase family protein n=1 Tax=Loktanella sp. R86503 TaxID=3093847 RepID=UPI0036DAA502
MSELLARAAAFVAGTPWQDWTLKPLAGDASNRRYLRLTGPDGDSVILMDADPAKGEAVAPFVAIAEWLCANGLTAPRILRRDTLRGLLLIDDLGPQTIAEAANAVAEDQLYDAAVDVLIALDGKAPPPDLAQMTPDVGADMVAITAQTYYACDAAPLVNAVHVALRANAPDANAMALRDYHAENLIWRSERMGLDRVGLLDFQDAFIAPRGYDLASLLRDIRRPVPPAQVTRQLARFSAATNTEPALFAAQVATLGAQRNLRILGVFARLVANGKTRYAAFLPSVWDALMCDLQHPALHDLQKVVVATLPPPKDRP